MTLDTVFNKGMIMENRGRRPIHDFSTHEIGKPRLYMKSKKINGKPISLTSLEVCARRYAKANNLTASKETVKSGIKITFKLGDKK